MRLDGLPHEGLAKARPSLESIKERINMTKEDLKARNNQAVEMSRTTQYGGMTLALGTIALTIFMVATALTDLVAAYLNKRED